MFQKLRKIVLLLLALLALGYLFYKFRNSIALEGFQWGMVAHSVGTARISLLMLGLVAIYGCFALRAVRWMRFSHAIGHMNFWNVYSATLMGFTCSFLLGRAGEPIRPVLIAKKDSLPVPSMFGVYVLERVFDMASAAVIAGVALLVYEHKGASSAAQNYRIVSLARTGGVLLFVLLGSAIAFLLYFRFHGAEWLARRLKKSAWQRGWRGKIVALLEGFSDGLQGIRTWNDLGAVLAYSAAHWFLVLLVYVWIAHAFSGQPALATMSLSGALLVLAFTLIGSAVQLPGVGGGAQLATFLVLTLIFGVEKEPAATVSIVLWLVTFAGCCLVGLPLLFREGWSMGELRRMATAEEEAAEAVESAEWARKVERIEERPR
ncbi:MAG: lysylphosphatidylglycerol synthase transmembrane domain-containing protein [Candidatus Acidiferrales bacterium]